MANEQLHTLMTQLRRLAAPKAECTLTDAELLDRFTSAHDEAAFELLAWRYGAMVLSLCRRLLRHPQDVEDAFQATFLVFVRKAHVIRKGEAVGSWLYKVAYRVAVRARADAARRTRHEQQAADPEALEPGAELLWRDLRPVLDQEVNRLPEKYRAPFILCYVEDKTIEEIARQLGCPRSTVGNRLARARARLRSRLTRRGLVLPASFLATVVTPNAASASVPAALMGATVKAATTVAAGGPAAFFGVSARAAALTRGVLRTMFLTKLQAGALILAVLAALWAVAGFLTRPLLNAQAPQTPAKAKRPAAAKAPRQAARRPRPRQAPGRLLFYRAGHLTLIGPNGKHSKQVSKNRGDFHPGSAWLSPDGKRIACLIQIDKEPKGGRDPRRKVYVRGLEDPEPGTDLKVEGQHVSWSPDGKHLIAADFVYGKENKDIKFVNWLVNVKTREKTALKLPDNHMVQDWSRDGKHFLTTELDLKKNPPSSRLYLVNRDGTKARALTDGSRPGFFGRLSPDGRKLLYLAPDPERKAKERSANLGLFLMDIAQRKSMRVQQQPLNGEIMGFAWSPDGKRIAYGWRQVHKKPKPQQETESHLVVADPDGKNPVTIATEKGSDTGVITIGWIDWR